MVYDIIGDIHGQADKLIGLLTQLNYQFNGQYYEPPHNHQAIFIGDLIDRGQQELQTLNIVFAMIDAGVAHAVMGNHEYNAIAYATINQQQPNHQSTPNHSTPNYLRPHTSENTKQHQAFLAEIPFGSTQHDFWLNRFYQLPLWLETPEACFVHACWDIDSMSVLLPVLDDKNCLTKRGLQLTGQKDSIEYKALERVLKGVEAPLPSGTYILDKEGKKRHEVRIKWWLNNLDHQPIHDIARAPQSSLTQIPPNAKTDHIDFILKTDKPIFIGHYWMNGTPTPLNNQVVCTDYSAAIDSGYLTCYQFDTSNPLPLSEKNFVQFNHHFQNENTP